MIKTPAFIKTHNESRCAIREDNYNHSFTKILRLVEEAKRDFPTLANGEIGIVIYGGETIKHIMGIEFPIPADVEIPSGYRQVSQMEFIL